ncbi:MarR family transcriptional regulator [Micromonospora sp. KC207]|uniref:MarR family winged helix-turn-helix transcriptional regulator n=1 Tax=Micromonospora sp. KC207 TaxID=2530377 RepID=UPI00104B154A|nr:MarR family transcriptional regulator [Micromonospora sp. KC207]TDC63711.1 MarR family transcriptional regulator [Micromonospora sp. KC207]
MHYAQRLLGHVRRADQASQAAKEFVLRDFEMTPAQQSALAILSDHDGMTAAQLARECAVTPQTMNSTLGRLEKRGLIERRRHPMHGTLIEIRMTPAGRDAFDRADKRVAELDAALSAGLTEEDLALLRDLLKRIGENAAAHIARADAASRRR